MLGPCGIATVNYILACSAVSILMTDAGVAFARSDIDTDWKLSDTDWKPSEQNLMKAARFRQATAVKAFTNSGAPNIDVDLPGNDMISRRVSRVRDLPTSGTNNNEALSSTSEPAFSIVHAAHTFRRGLAMIGLGSKTSRRRGVMAWKGDHYEQPKRRTPAEKKLDQEIAAKTLQVALTKKQRVTAEKAKHKAMLTKAKFETRIVYLRKKAKQAAMNYGHYYLLCREKAAKKAAQQAAVYDKQADMLKELSIRAKETAHKKAKEIKRATGKLKVLKLSVKKSMEEKANKALIKRAGKEKKKK